MKSRRDRSCDTAFVLSLCLVFLASIGLTLVSVTQGKNKALITSDGKDYYVWARSILLDHDIDFSNDYQLLPGSGSNPAASVVWSPAGHAVNKYPVGMAILETPGLLVGHVVARYVVHSSTNGVTAPYQIAVAWSLLILYFVSFLLLYRAMLDLGVTRMWAFGFCLTALLGTNLIHYVAKEMTMVHAAGVAVFNILLFLSVRWFGEHRRIHVAHGILLGALVGLLFLVRNTNILILPVLAAVVWTRRRVYVSEVLPALFGAAAIAALQPVSLWFLWGRLRFSTYYNESFTSGISGVINALGSARHGLLVYSPWYSVLLLIAAYGAFRLPQARRVCIAAIASFLLMAIVNGTWWCWWFGYSFGNRAFIETLPSLSLAAALSVSRLSIGRKVTIALMVVMLAVVVLNLYLWIGFLLQAYPLGGDHTIAQAYLWPFFHSPASLINRLSQ
ncbi:MAG: hypothetical protein NTX53_08325 [candidate division WOR-3 bacterium]|nr:hypothetical protein [candidate division WOR-3 bacterium]